MARCHRIGQTKPVTIYRLVTQDSVEEQALGRLAKKLYLSIKVTTTATDRTMTNDKAPTFSKSELVKLLRGGTSALTTPIGDDWNTKPIEEILRESRERQKKREDMIVMSDEEVESMESELLKDHERIQTTLFDGKVLHRTNKEITDGIFPSNFTVDIYRMAKSYETSTYRKNSRNRRIFNQQRISLLRTMGGLPYIFSKLCGPTKTSTSGLSTSKLVSMVS